MYIRINRKRAKSISFQFRDSTSPRTDYVYRENGTMAERKPAAAADINAVLGVVSDSGVELRKIVSFPLFYYFYYLLSARLLYDERKDSERENCQQPSRLLVATFIPNKIFFSDEIHRRSVVKIHLKKEEFICMCMCVFLYASKGM